jgi:hypothetical protein
MNKDGANNVLDRLLEPGDIGVRFLALRDLVKPDRKELEPVKIQAHREGPIAVILDKMMKAG